MPEADLVAGAIATGASPENGDGGTKENQSEGKVTESASDWRNEVAVDLRPKLERFKTPADLAKSYIELERMSSKAVQDMSAEERDRLYKRLGRPEKPGDYELANLALPTGIPRDPKADEELKAFAHEQGFTKAQLKALHEWSMKRAIDGIVASRQAEQKQVDEFDDALRKEWGASKDENEAKVNSLIQKFGGDVAVKFFNGGPGKNPVMKKFLFDIAKTMSDETFIGGSVAPMNRVAGGDNMVVDFSKSPELLGTNRYGRR